MTSPTNPTNTTDLTHARKVAEAATQGEWTVYPHPIGGGAFAAMEELRYQVENTDPIGANLYLLNADGKCPAITGCGPNSEANATFIATFDPPTILSLIAQLEAATLALEEADRKNDALNAEWNDALAQLEAARAREAVLREALGQIERWDGFPETGRFWANTDGNLTDSPMSYAACYGWNGERNFMRNIARTALENEHDG